MGKNGGILGGMGPPAVSLAFFAYIFLCAPPLARALKAGLEQPEPLWGAGWLLFAVLLLEPFGLRWKLRFLRRRNAEEHFEPQGSMLGIFSAAAIGHMIVTVVTGMVALDCWGAAGQGAETETNALGIVVVVLVLKEFAAWFACAGQGTAREPPGHWKEHLADFLLLAFGCVAYTAWWESLLDIGQINTEGWKLKLLLMPFLGLLFLFLYLPLRLPFLLEEGYLRPKQGRALRIAADLALGAVLGLWPAFA